MEVKKHGGNMKEDSPKIVFAALKKKKKKKITKKLGELCNSLKLQASGTESELLQKLLPFKDDLALLDALLHNLCQEEL